jgi:ecotin
MRSAGAQVLLLLCGWMAAVTVAQPGGDDLKPFPAAAAGQQRIVIRVPQVENPDDRKVEVMVGRTLMVDCNRQSLGGTVTQEEAKGWGYSYYVLDVLRGPASTMMACPPGTPRREQFVHVNSELLAALRYNPKVPIVLYVPAGTQVRYRIWSAGREFKDAGAE